MRQILKNELKEQIAANLRSLEKKQGITTEDLIDAIPDLMRVLTAYYNAPKSKQACEYVRRLIQEIISDPQYECQDIRSMFVRHIIAGYKRKFKKQWVWVNTDDDDKDKFIEMRDRRIAGTLEKTTQIAEVIKAKKPLDKTNEAVKKYNEKIAIPSEDGSITTEQKTEEEEQPQDQQEERRATDDGGE